VFVSSVWMRSNGVRLAVKGSQSFGNRMGGLGAVNGRCLLMGGKARGKGSVLADLG
jgi:hypothetical protein